MRSIPASSLLPLCLSWQSPRLVCEFGEPFCIVFRVVHGNIRDRAIQVLKLRSPDVLPIIARYLATMTYKAGILGDGHGKARDTVARERYPPYWLVGFRVSVRITTD